MAPPKRPWFRFYVEALTDPKLRRLSAEERWLWVVVLGLARQSPIPGWLLVTESIPMEPDDMAEMAGVTSAKVGKGLGKMIDLGLVIQDKDGVYRVNKWDDRQFESDLSTERANKSRSNNKASTMQQPIGGEAAPPETEDREQRTETDAVLPSDHNQTSTPDPSSWSDDQAFIEAGRIAARSYAGTFTKGFDHYATGAASKIRQERGWMIPKLRDRGFTLEQAAAALASKEPLVCDDDFDSLAAILADPEFVPADRIGAA